MDVDDGRALAQAIVNTIREPLLVLDEDLQVVAASRSFYLSFKVDRQDVQGRPVYALATASGTSRSSGCCWKKSCRSTP
jgi:chemotaxis protein methyltransferase CheR